MAEIIIPNDLKESLEQIVKDSNEFSSVNDYATYILKQVADKKKASQTQSHQDQAYSKEDEAKIKERLQNLGYLD
ncbi:MAG: CopG family transcriptional regulator [Patescibacteria group bacterium]